MFDAEDGIKWPVARTTVLTAALTLGAACGGPASLDEGQETTSSALSMTAVYFEESDLSNTAFERVYLNVPDSDPNAIYFVSPTQTFNSMFSAQTLNGNPIGVMFDNEQNNWVIFNENKAAMPLGTGFSVYTRAATSNVFKMVAGQNGNLAVTDTAYINNPYTNGNPNALVWVTQNFNTHPGSFPGEYGGDLNPHNVGVKYDSFRGQWAIFNLDRQVIVGAAFNVIVESGAQQSFFVKTAAAATSQLIISDPRINGRSTAKIMVTPVLNPGGRSNLVYSNHPVGACYNSNGQWAVCNFDAAVIPAGASYNVWILG